VRDKQLHFHLLTAKDHVRVKYERVSEKTHKPVAWNDLVKGYEYSKGRYVVLTPEDFDAAALAKTRTIDILDFVNAEDVDDRFFDKPYYVTAGAGGDRAYALLRETIREAGRIGIAKFVLRDRQHLAAIEVIEDALVLSTLRFADELIPASEYSFPSAKGQRAGDLKTARMLVDELSAEWNPEKYTDDYRQNLVRIIDARKKGQEATLAPEESDRSGNVVDLMERLRASLEGGGRAAKGGARSASRAAGTARKKATKAAPGKTKRRTGRAA
ncbi:MAG: Ku protein, partial [Geminicoccaceae bacterium]